MQWLTLAAKTQDIAIYEICGYPDEGIKRYIVSTAQTRAICNKPEITGLEYTTKLRAAVTLALQHFPEKKVFEIDDQSLCELVFLRGGLNFGIKEALHTAFGFNNHYATFMSSQRFKDARHRWGVRENSYRKFAFPSGPCTLVTGDVVATGVTLRAGVGAMLDEFIKEQRTLENMVLFTIGCHKTEKVLSKFLSKLRTEFPDFGNVYVVYFEGKFKLVDSKTKLNIGIPGTDFIRKDCLLAPEFELSQYEHISHALERCIIYDAGSRAFDIKEYVHDVVDYWKQVMNLAQQGVTLHEALKERFPERGYRDMQQFQQTKKEQWHGVHEDFLNELYTAYTTRWSPEFCVYAKTAAALKEVCKEQIQKIGGRNE